MSAQSAVRLAPPTGTPSHTRAPLVNNAMNSLGPVRKSPGRQRGFNSPRDAGPKKNLSSRAPSERKIIPLPPRAQLAKTNSVSLNDDDRLVLRHALNHMTPLDLHSGILTALNTISASEATRLLKGLEEAIRLGNSKDAVALKNKRHCVRCHRAYMEKDNTPDICMYNHKPPVGVTSDHGVFNMVFPCCGEMQKDAPLRCKVGARRHTTVPPIWSDFRACANYVVPLPEVAEGGDTDVEDQKRD